MDEKTKFGELLGSEFNVGDIVEWTTWNNQIDGWDSNYGIITGMSNEVRSNRVVSVSRVVPLHEPKYELEFFTMSLKLVSRSDALNEL